jgi:DNA polymerase-3 subunit epsilon
VVVDLETTGGSPECAAITEIGAVRVHGSQADPAAAEFSTLVNPGRAIPPHVTALTGISDALVAAAPRVDEVLPQFIRFAAGAVLVAHNAPFDIGFLAAACAEHQLNWPDPPTLDTAALARRVLTTDEVRDCRLATLARFFGASTPPNHRALDDARATAQVLHGLLGRLANRGVHTFEALHGLTSRSALSALPAAQQRRMSQLTAAIPRTPGVCLFTAADGQVLHIVKSSDMHARACGYFAAAETRQQIRAMVEMTDHILPLSCATGLEAEVAEIRLIALHRPPHSDWPDNGPPRGDQGPGNQGDGSSHGNRPYWLPPYGDCQLLNDNEPHKGDEPGSMGAVPLGTVQPGAPPLGTVQSGTPPLGTVQSGTARIGAARIGAAGMGAEQGQVSALASARRVVAARPRFSGGWDVAWIRRGSLTATATVPRGGGPPAEADLVPLGDLAGLPCPGERETDEARDATVAGTARYAEAACLLRWLMSPGVRLIEVDGTWCSTPPR